MRSDDFPAELKAVLPADTVAAWRILRQEVPDECVLFGGTAITAHLHHRVSRDLDFFFTGDLDLAGLACHLESLRPTAVSELDADTFNGTFGATKVQFLRAAGQTDIESPTEVAGLWVAGLRDLMSTKLKVILDRGELRDYFDVMVIDGEPGFSVEQGLADYQQRYADQNQNNLVSIVRALGYLEDVTDDPGLPLPRERIEAFWRRRQPDLIKNLQSAASKP